MPKPVAESPFPMRINKYLALKKYSTRRGADDIIKKKQVFINGRLAVLGDKVWSTDTVEVKFHKKPVELMYFAYNKPKGVGVTGEKTAEKTEAKNSKQADAGAASFPVGALEKESSGLMILTNDGRITERLLSPLYVHEREYFVVTKNRLRPTFKERMEAGVNIEGTQTERCKVEILDEDSFRVTFRDEKKHQLRRMCAALFQEIRSIECTRIMNVELGGLGEGGRREIRGTELKLFLEGLKLL